MGYCFTNTKFNVFIVWLRDISPAAIKIEPEEDNGFSHSPQHNKTSKREYHDEEWVSYRLNQILYCILPVLSLLVVRNSQIISMFVYRFENKPKKVKTEHDKKAKKRKHEYEEDEEDEVHYVLMLFW